MTNIRGNNKKPLILAVDDKPELLVMLTQMLYDRYSVVAVTSAVAAIKALRVHTPDLFLLDIEMPDMNGYDLAALLRKHENFKETPIIFLTSMNTREDVLAAIRHGGNSYLVKPVDKDTLYAKVAQWLC